MLARLAEAGGLELRIFRRDGQRFSSSHRPDLAEAPDSNADIMAEFLNHKKGQTWQSIPGNVSNVSGTHTVFLTFTSGQPADFVNVNWFKFRK